MPSSSLTLRYLAPRGYLAHVMKPSQIVLHIFYFNILLLVFLAEANPRVRFLFVSPARGQMNMHWHPMHFGAYITLAERAVVHGAVRTTCSRRTIFKSDGSNDTRAGLPSSSVRDFLPRLGVMMLLLLYRSLHPSALYLVIAYGVIAVDEPDARAKESEKRVTNSSFGSSSLNLIELPNRFFFYSSSAQSMGYTRVEISASRWWTRHRRRCV